MNVFELRRAFPPARPQAVLMLRIADLGGVESETRSGTAP